MALVSARLYYIPCPAGIQGHSGWSRDRTTTMVQAMEAGAKNPGHARVHRLRAPETDDVSLGLIQRGSTGTGAGRPPALVVHGSTLGAALFDLPVAGYSMLSALAGTGRAAYAIDVRGYGLSLQSRVMDAPPDANPPF